MVIFISYSLNFFHIFSDAQRKIGYYFNGPPDTNNSFYFDWVTNDSCVITWFLNSLEKKVSSGVISFMTVNNICDTFKEICSNKKNIVRAFDLYERFFLLSNKRDIYVCLLLIGQIGCHQPLITNLKILKEYH